MKLMAFLESRIWFLGLVGTEKTALKLINRHGFLSICWMKQLRTVVSNMPKKPMHYAALSSDETSKFFPWGGDEDFSNFLLMRRHCIYCYPYCLSCWKLKLPLCSMLVICALTDINGNANERVLLFDRWQTLWSVGLVISQSLVLHIWLWKRLWLIFRRSFSWMPHVYALMNLSSPLTLNHHLTPRWKQVAYVRKFRIFFSGSSRNRTRVFY